MGHRRIAAVKGARLGRAHPGHGVEHRAAPFGCPQIAAQHGIAVGERTARVETVDQRRDLVAARPPAAKAAMGGVIGEFHRRHRPYLVTEAPQGQQGRGVADMTEGHLGLDGENVHRWASPVGG